MFDTEKWDRRFLGLAEHISQWSKDLSTRVGSCVIDKKNRIISMGYNGFAQGTDDSPSKYEDRQYKYSTVIHAEINSILFAQRNLADCQIYTWPFMPCSNCAAAIIQAGITRVVAPKAPQDKIERWSKSFEISTQLFKEAGVELKLYD